MNEKNLFAIVILMKDRGLRMNLQTFIAEEKMLSQSEFPNRDSSPT